MADLREYSSYYGNAGNFDEPAPDLGVLGAEYAPNLARTSGVLISQALGRRVISPTVIATLIPGETDHIVFLHRPTMYRMPGPLHMLAITVWGNVGHECMPYILDPTAFEELPAMRALQIARGYVIDNGKTEYMIECIGGLNVASCLADNHAQFDFVIHLV